MLIRMGVFRQILWEALLHEVDISRLMPRVSKGRGLITTASFMGERLVAISDVDSSPIDDIEVPTVVGSVSGIMSSNGWVLNTLYADDPITAIYLLGAALAKWKNVTPDKAVSPAAKAVIKRYWDDNKDNPKLVSQTEEDPAADLKKSLGWKSSQLSSGDFLSAVFHDPGNIALDDMFSTGDQIVNKYVSSNPDLDSDDDVKDLIGAGAVMGFKSAYSSDKKTGRSSEN